MSGLQVYLDNADWSNLQQGKASAAEGELRRLAEDGSIALLISEEHLLETAGLSYGREKRLDFIRSFPGTFRFPCTTHDILRHEAWRLVELVEGREAPPLSVEMQAMTTYSRDELMEEVQALELVRWIDYTSAALIAQGRPLSGDSSGADVRSTDRMLAALGKKDAKEAARQLAIKGRVQHEEVGSLVSRLDALFEGIQSGDRERVAALIEGQLRESEQAGTADFASNLRQVAPLMTSRALARQALGPVFNEAVFPYLPEEVAADHTCVVRVAAAWKQAHVRSQVRGLAAYVALVELMHFDPGRQYPGSEHADRRHAVYAACVHLVTCDKRNAEPLRKALQGESPFPHVVKTEHLDAVVRALLKIRDIVGSLQ